MPEQDPNHHTDAQDLGKEAGLNYTTAGADQSLTNAHKRVANYLVHRMLWDQQEKIDLDDLGWSPDGSMRIEDKLDGR